MIPELQVILAQRSKTGTPLVDYTVVDRSDGTGPQIAGWNVANLGAQPTPAEIAAVTPAQIAANQTAQHDADLTTLADRTDIRAVTQALWECIPNPTLTKPQLRARIIAILKSL